MQRRRSVLRTIVCLSLGVAVSVLLAWAIAAWGVPSRQEIHHDPTPDEVLQKGGFAVPSDWDLGTHVVQAGTWGGFRYDLVTEQRWMGSRLGAMAGSANRSVERVRVGWPRPCLEWFSAERSSWPSRSNAQFAPERRGLDMVWYEGAAALPARGACYPFAERRLPIKAVWGGLVLDSVVFGSVLLATLAVLGRSKRFVRTIQGKCVGCGYLCRGVPGGICPECGRAVGNGLAKSGEVV